MQNCLRWSGRQPPALPGRFAPYVQSSVALVVVVVPWHWSGALRIALVSGFAVHVVFAPAHPWGLLASQLRPRGLPVRPPRGLPQNRAQDRRLSAAVTTTYIGRSLIVKTCSHTRITSYNDLALQDPALQLPLCPALRGLIQVRLRPQTSPS